MSLLSRLLERLGYVKLSEYGLQLEQGRLIPTTHNHPMLTAGGRPYLPASQRSAAAHQPMPPYPTHRPPEGFGPPTGPPIRVPMQPVTALGPGVAPMDRRPLDQRRLDLDFDVSDTPMPVRVRSTPSPQRMQGRRTLPPHERSPQMAPRPTRRPTQAPRPEPARPPIERAAEPQLPAPERVAGSQNIRPQAPSSLPPDELALSETLQSPDGDGARRRALAGSVPEGDLRFVDGVYETVDRRAPRRRFPVSPQTGARTVMASHSVGARASKRRG